MTLRKHLQPLAYAALALGYLVVMNRKAYGVGAA